MHDEATEARPTVTRSTAPTEMIRASGLSKVYASGPRRVTVFEDLSIAVREGEMIAILGPSGAGKSTFLHLLGGLDRPTAGTVEVGSFDITKLSDVDLARFRNDKIGFIFQFHHLLPEFTALENTMMPLLIGGLGRRESRDRAAGLLERIGLAERLHHRPGELSGGEAQRVALARALVHRPRVLLADEPTGNLDSRTGEAVHSVLQSVHVSEGLTSVIVTHNERLAALCDRVYHLEDGKLVESADISG